MSNAAIQFDPTSLAKYGRLALIARELVEGFLSGAHKSPYKGYSVEFAEHRQYYPGDEIRHIDWRAYGKTDRYFIKEFEEETNLRAWLLVDASGSMAYRGGGKKGSGTLNAKVPDPLFPAPGKFEYARYLAASLSYLMLHQRDAVGLVTHDTRLRQLIKPRANAKHLLRLLQTLERTEPGGETSLAPLWHDLAPQFKRRGLVVILSDCFEQMGPLLRALRHFRHRRHEVLLFHILAPEEINFPFAKWTQFRNLEVAGQKLLVDPQRLRKEYLKNFETFCNELRDQARAMGVDYQLLRTDDPVDRALGAYLTKRQNQT